VKAPFWKLSGAGNDFVLLHGVPKGRSARALARRLCDRHAGIGADGLLVMTRRAGKVRLDYRNADGSRAFCANGSRCAVAWADAQGWLKGKNIQLETDRGPLPARLTGRNRVEIAMPAPRNLRLGLNLAVAGHPIQAHFVDTGVPHAVVFVPDIKKARVTELGRILRRHEAFGRAGANVDFVEIAGDALLIRTYERGVENETLACGTGIVAAAFVSRVLGFSGSRVKVKTRGGHTLSVSFGEGPRLEGPAETVFKGEIEL